MNPETVPHPDSSGDAPIATADHKDCGCGCGGTGGCAESGSSEPARLRRRKFLVGGIGVGTFAATLASRPAFAACNNLTGLVSPSGSHAASCTSSGGLTPGFWMNHATCWPATIHPSQQLSYWFTTPNVPTTFTNFSGASETFQTALCPPNGQDNFAFQLAAALLNAESSHTQTSFGYQGAAAFAASCIRAMQALSYEGPGFPDIQARISTMNAAGNIASWCGAAVKICK